MRRGPVYSFVKRDPVRRVVRERQDQRAVLLVLEDCRHFTPPILPDTQKSMKGWRQELHERLTELIGRESPGNSISGAWWVNNEHVGTHNGCPGFINNPHGDRR